MSQEDKQLLLQDLSARLPYGVKLKGRCDITTLLQIRVIEDRIVILTTTWCGEIKAFYKENLDGCKPYLRPMSSMTDKEKTEYRNIAPGIVWNHGIQFPTTNKIDWLNAHHFDYRGLIEKGLALEAPEGTY